MTIFAMAQRIKIHICPRCTERSHPVSVRPGVVAVCRLQASRHYRLVRHEPAAPVNVSRRNIIKSVLVISAPPKTEYGAHRRHAPAGCCTCCGLQGADHHTVCHGSPCASSLARIRSCCIPENRLLPLPLSLNTVTLSGHKSAR